MTKSWHPRLQVNLKKSEFLPLKNWFDNSKKHPAFKHICLKAYRDWTAVVHINNKIVKESPDGGAKEAEFQNQKSSQKRAGSPDGGAKEAECQNHKSSQETTVRRVPNAKTNQGCLVGS